MKDLFYVEGFSEVAFVRSYMISNSIAFSEDVSDLLNNKVMIYIKNCKSDSAIKPSLLKDKWLLDQLSTPEVRVWIVCDIENFPCFTSFRNDFLKFTTNEKINANFIFINSKPKIEYEYFDDIEHIKTTVRSIKNTLNLNQSTITQNSLVKIELLTDTRINKYIKLENFCRANYNNFSKKLFAEKYFFSLHSANKTIRITERLKNKILSDQLTLPELDKK